MSDTMGSLAATDEYDPFAAEKFVNPAVKQAMGDILTLPQRAIQNSQFAVDTGTYDPGPVLEAATLPMGTGAIAGVPMRAGEAVLGAGPIRAYHSSPHDFDRFDLSKIGSGEGAQVYGHGLYFAENPAVSGQGGQYWKQFKDRFSGTPEGTAAMYLQSAKFDREKAAQMLRDSLARDEARASTFTPSELSDYRALIGGRKKSIEMIESGQPVGPRTYEVNINADPAHFLDWDKTVPLDHPLRQMVAGSARTAFDRATTGTNRNIAKDALLAAEGENLTGQGAYEQLARTNTRPGLFPEINLKQPARASAMLNEAGIPGIKYLDEGSRGVWDVRENPKGFRGQQSISPGYGGKLSEYFPTQEAAQDWINKARTSNYVVFDPNRVQIRKKYAVPGAIGAGGMGALAAQDNYQPGGL